MPRFPKRTLAVVALAAALAAPSLAGAHCDALDGPVVVAAKRALDAGDVDAVLGWVHPAGEREVRDAFARTVAVRKLSPDARGLADTWFFETVVRVHREGEGAPFTGLKPAGLPLPASVAAADAAVASGDAARLEALLVESVRHGLRERFAAVQAKPAGKKPKVEDVRAWVAGYVTFVHYALGVHTAAAAGAHHAEPAHGARVEPAAHVEHGAHADPAKPAEHAKPAAKPGCACGH